jgi:hypothetical protein
VFEAAALGVGGGGDVQTGPWVRWGQRGGRGRGRGYDDFNHQHNGDEWGLIKINGDISIGILEGYFIYHWIL